MCYKKGEKMKMKNFFRIIFTLILTSSLCFAQVGNLKFININEQLPNIVGGAKIVNGIKYEMNKE